MSPSHGRDYFENSCMKTAFPCALNAVIRGYSYVRWHIYQSPIPPFYIFFTPIMGEHGPLCPLAIPVTVVQPGFVNGGPKRGSGGGCWKGGGVSPSHGREIF